MTNLWKQISPLTDLEKTTDLAAIKPIYDTWNASRRELEKSSPGNLKEFNSRLVRRLSIETGILERVYDLDRGTTEALVAVGFVEDLVSRSSTDVEPSFLIDVLRDQESAIQLVMDCISHNRPLTKSVIHELHQILMRHQHTTIAKDQFGRRVEIPLIKGRYKENHNNPERPGGIIHEYCPPMHVESEMDNLLQWLTEYDHDDPIIVAAWFHHRFTQIHPYQDGNGRLARVLTTLILLRANLLPLVIDRDLRVEYISSLEAADRGDISPLAQIFARLERAAILQALSVDVDAEITHQKTLAVTKAVVNNLSEKFGKRKIAKNNKLRKVNEVALSLRGKARKTLEESFTQLKQAISQIADPELNIADGGPDRANSHWYKYEVVKTASAAGKFANFTEAHYFVKSAIKSEEERLVFVVSLHHIGRDLSGVMEATAFARLESFEDPDDRHFVSQDFFVCSMEPFVFTNQTQPEEIEEPFFHWLDAAIAVAIKEYGDRL